MSLRLFLTPILLAGCLLGEVKFTQSPSEIAVTINDRPFTTFYFGPATTKPYLHPLRSATGTVVTRGYPMEEIAGEPKDHPHHRGLFFGHGEVNGINFWATEPLPKAPNTGRIVMKSISAHDGKKTGTIEGTFDWNDPNGKTLLTETRVMTFHSSPSDERIFDLDITLTPAVPVTFGDTKEGTLAIRLTPALDEKHSGEMVNAEGKKGMKDVWGARSNWVDYAGDIGGQRLGIAIFDYPGNPSHPTRWHSRDYGLFAVNPFGQKGFDKNAPEAHITGQPGVPMRFRYRIVIHPGDAQSANIARQWLKYANEK